MVYLFWMSELGSGGCATRPRLVLRHIAKCRLRRGARVTPAMVVVLLRDVEVIAKRTRDAEGSMTAAVG